MTPTPRWTRLVEARAAALFAARAESPALVLVGAGRSPCVGPGALVMAPPADGALPFAERSFAAVLDMRPPDEPCVPVAELARVCRPEGAVLTVTSSHTRAALADTLAGAGCVVDDTIPFDFLGSGSPWAARLGARAAGVLEELETHLAAGGVCAAATLLEAEVVAHLPPGATASAFVVGRRGAARPTPARPSVRVRLDEPEFRAALLRLAQDDAVVRWAAFLDAEVLSPAGVMFDLARYLDEIGAVSPAELRPGLWRWPGFETYRFLQAAGHRMAAGTAAALADAREPASPRLAATLAYDLVETLNALFDRCLVSEGSWSG